MNRMFPTFQALLPEAATHEDSIGTPACRWTETEPPGSVTYYSSCPACVVAFHAVARRLPDQDVYAINKTDVAGYGPAANELVLRYGLPLPLVPESA